MYFYCYDYVLLLLLLCLTTLTEVFPCFFLSCKANARVKPAKDGARPAPFLIFVLFYVLFVYMCTVLLPPGGYPIAVKYIISQQNLYECANCQLAFLCSHVIQEKRNGFSQNCVLGSFTKICGRAPISIKARQL